ncbi:MAG: TetR/AcrR family transcriptional regulator [Acidobacteriota bacterium]|nr:TetR/AcrR family transcriptional regulator [Acidobacteriota bacterium]
MTDQDPKATKDRILDAAEERFADEGFSTSLRSITAHAGVNLAAIHYHFGSKEALLESVFVRRLAPINRERIELLDAIESSPTGARSVERILEAFVGPALRLYNAGDEVGPRLMRLCGRILAEPSDDVQELFLAQFKEVAGRFTAAFRRALPELPAEELFWRIHFVIGAMAHTMAGSHRLRFLSGGLCETGDADATIRRLVDFLAAGLRAPVGTDVAGGRS